MRQIGRITVGMLVCGLVSLAHLVPASSQTNSTADSEHDGQHAFDFEIGTWKSHISHRLHPLSGSNTWVPMEATVVVRKVWDGRANLMELEADTSNGHLEELDIRLYDAKSKQWTQNYATSGDNIVDKPLFGQFKNGRGEFVGEDTFNNRTILVRHIFSDITPDSHHFEQSFSQDGGKTWESNFVATLTREKE